MFCYRHPERPAVEQCETCGRPLCAACLWYTEDGERLCEEHAAARKAIGEPVVSPEKYVEAHDEVEAAALRQAPAPAAPYQGNTLDVLALVAVVIGVVAFSANFGGVYLFPVFGIVLGIAAVLQASQSLNPKRTATLGWVAIGTSAVGILFWLLIIFGCLGLTFLPLFLSNVLNPSTPLVFPTSTPYLTPTP